MLSVGLPATGGIVWHCAIRRHRMRHFEQLFSRTSGGPCFMIRLLRTRAALAAAGESNNRLEKHHLCGYFRWREYVVNDFFEMTLWYAPLRDTDDHVRTEYS